jgi:5-deoxy-glucuronate isomerase
MEIRDLGAGANLELSAPPGEEMAAILIAGEVRGGAEVAGRGSPFERPLAGWFLPPGAALTVAATAPSAVAVVETKGAELDGTGGEPTFVEHAEGELRGRDEWERIVTTLIDPASCGSRRLIAGQTVHADGGWSSYPPHRHDGSGGEPYFEEIYHYRFDPPAGFGVQAIYADDGLAEANLIRDADTLTIDRGYHPVCAAPGYRFTYFWALCGPAERFQQVDDPVHSWVAEAR